MPSSTSKQHRTSRGINDEVDFGLLLKFVSPPDTPDSASTVFSPSSLYIPRNPHRLSARSPYTYEPSLSSLKTVELPFPSPSPSPSTEPALSPPPLPKKPRLRPTSAPVGSLALTPSPFTPLPPPLVKPPSGVKERPKTLSCDLGTAFSTLVYEIVHEDAEEAAVDSVAVLDADAFRSASARGRSRRRRNAFSASDALVESWRADQARRASSVAASAAGVASRWSSESPVRSRWSYSTGEVEDDSDTPSFRCRGAVDWEEYGEVGWGAA
ncbi:hypothetical protein JCM8097_003597 [Rhodosporidiobolus ruineniae]